MGTQSPELDRFIHLLSRQNRLLVLGGLAVIAHGLSRATKDADIWMEPLATSEEWATRLLEVCKTFPHVTIATLPEWISVTPEELASAIEDVGLVRILGLECPLDIFRRPNNFEEAEFDRVFAHATPIEDGTWLSSPLDLIVTKEETGRPHDRADISFLESKVRIEFSRQLATASLVEARDLLDRYVDHVILGVALKNPNREVQELAKDLLRELAEAGDPYARDLLSE